MHETCYLKLVRVLGNCTRVVYVALILLTTLFKGYDIKSDFLRLQPIYRIVGAVT